MIDQSEENEKISPSQKQLNPQTQKQQSVLNDCKNPLVGDSPVPSTASHLFLLQDQLKSQSLCKQAEQLMKKQLSDQAIGLLKQSIELYPEVDNQFLGMGCFQDRIGYHYGSLWKWVELVKGQRVSSASPYDLLALCLSIEKDLKPHKQWYLNMLQDHPNNQKLTFGLATLYYNQKQFKEAEQSYKRTIQLAPHLQQPFIRISFIYCLKWNRDSEALEWSKEALTRSPTNHYALLISALCNKDLDQRIQELKKIIELVPNYARPYNGLGNAYYNHKQYDNAINYYKQCIEVNDMYEHPYYGLGSIYNQLGDLDQSIKWYKRCIQVSPNYDYPHYGLGIAYNNKNDMPNAIYWFKQCIRINPNYDCPYYALGNIYRLGKDYHQAIDYYRQSLQQKPIDPLCFVNLALTLINTHQYKLALYYFEKAHKHLDEDKMLSVANIDYIKQQLEHYLKEAKKHQRSCKGFLTLREKIHLHQLAADFGEEYRLLLEEKHQSKK